MDKKQQQPQGSLVNNQGDQRKSRQKQHEDQKQHQRFLRSFLPPATPPPAVTTPHPPPNVTSTDQSAAEHFSSSHHQSSPPAGAEETMTLRCPLVGYTHELLIATLDDYPALSVYSGPGEWVYVTLELQAAVDVMRWVKGQNDWESNPLFTCSELPYTPSEPPQPLLQFKICQTPPPLHLRSTL